MNTRCSSPVLHSAKNVENSGWDVFPINSNRKIKSTDKFSIMLKTATPSVPDISASMWIAIREKTASNTYSKEVAKPRRRGLTASLKAQVRRWKLRFPSLRNIMYPSEIRTAAAFEKKKPKLQPAIPQSKWNSSR